MNKKEVAEYLGISERGVQRAAERGELSVRMERGRRGDVAVYDPDEVRHLKAKRDAERATMRPAVIPVDADEHTAAPVNSNGQGNAQLALISGGGEVLTMLIRETVAATVEAVHTSPVLLTLVEAAQVTGLSADALRRAIKAGALDGRKIGRGYKVRPADARAYAVKVWNEAKV
jgi:excisionase family DNA binding protein